jgi:methylated-DNA-[protein]-cysteine S-methyltransferase
LRFNKECIMKLFLSRLDSPLGAMLLVTDAQKVVRALDFADHHARLHRGLREQYGEVELSEVPAPAEIADALARYFDGELEALDTLRTQTAGSELQHRVWAALRRIPAGTTTTYGKLAKELGFDDPRAAIDMGASQWRQPDRRHRAVPSGHRQQWRPQGLCLGSASQTLVAGAREGDSVQEGSAADRHAAGVLIPGRLVQPICHHRSISKNRIACG